MIKIVLNIEEVINILIDKTHGGIYPEHNSVKVLLLTRENRVIFSTDEKDAFFDEVSYLMPGPEHHGADNRSYFISRDGHNRVLVTSVRSTGHKEYRSLDWTMLIILDEEDAFAPLIQLRNKVAAVSFAVTLPALFLGVFLSVRIAGNVRRLRDASAKIGEGDLSCRIEDESNDEIGDLTLTFNKMVQSLKERTDALNNEMVARKTAEEKSADTALEWAMTFDSIPDHVSILSKDFRIMRVNQSLADFLGVSKEEVTGKICYEVFHGTKGP